MRSSRALGRAIYAVAALAVAAVGAAAPGGSVVPHDHVSYLDNGVIKLGIDLDLGGAITYLSRSGDAVNVVNSFDWGRQIQMSHYSGPVPFEPNGKKPRPEWAGLGWNPIQSGDCFGHRSRVLAHRNDGKTLYVKSTPMQWPLEDEPGECTFECWIRLEGKAAIVRSRMVNRRSDTTQYPARGQELPAVYTNGPWWRLMTYTGDRPFKGGELAQMPAKMPWTGWRATESWAALVDDRGWGLGIWEPGAYAFIGGFAGEPGAGGPKDNPTGYIAPLQQEVIDHNIAYEYNYTLILDDLAGIRKYVYDRAGTTARPIWRFDGGRKHWSYANATDSGWPIKDCLDVSLERDDPQLIGPAGFWQAKDAPVLVIEGAWKTREKTAQVFWSSVDSNNEMTPANCLEFAVIPDGRFRTYEVDLSASPGYHGAITGLRMDPEASGHPGDRVRIRSIGFRAKR